MCVCAFLLFSADSLVFYQNNIYAAADVDGVPSTTAPVLALTYFTVLPSGKSGSELTVEELTTPILITLAHQPIAPQCRFWNNSGNQWSVHGCYVHVNTTNSTTCACNHLTAFNVGQMKLKDLFVPPARQLRASDFINFFNPANLLAHPVPVIAVSALLLLWLLLTLITEYMPASIQVHTRQHARVFVECTA
jgi:hypothetical protein